MKTSIFKRSCAGMLAFAFLLTTMLSVGGTTAFATGTQEKVYIVSFPRSGDVSSNTGWGHPAHSYLNGWSAEKSEWTITRAIGGYNGQACYCIEPGVFQQTGDTLTQKDENFWDNYPDDYNDAISPYTIKLFIGRIMQYGYTGNLSTSWRSNNAGADDLCNLIATQLLIWEAVIITKSVSRFSRNTVDCLKYTRELKALGIPVIFEKEGLNTMHSTSEIYISMHGIFAQSESESLSGNVRMGKAMSAKKGKVAFSYKNFLGYRRGVDNQPEIDPEQAEIIRLIFDRYLEGDSLQAIKDLLESKGYLSPTRKTTWSVATIRSILTNEKYKGDARLQKTYVIDCISHRAKINDDRPQYYVENNHPPIVSREIFDRVQEEMARRASKRKVKEKGTKTESGKYSSKYALTDMLICGHCGTPYSPKVVKYRLKTKTDKRA